MSKCESLDGQCGDSWCNCDEVRKRTAAPHVHFEIKTKHGNTAMIKGNPNMPRKTREALAEMIDAVVKSANAGKLKT